MDVQSHIRGRRTGTRTNENWSECLSERVFDELAFSTCLQRCARVVSLITVILVCHKTKRNKSHSRLLFLISKFTCFVIHRILRRVRKTHNRRSRKFLAASAHANRDLWDALNCQLNQITVSFLNFLPRLKRKIEFLSRDDPIRNLALYLHFHSLGRWRSLLMTRNQLHLRLDSDYFGRKSLTRKTAENNFIAAGLTTSAYLNTGDR